MPEVIEIRTYPSDRRTGDRAVRPYSVCTGGTSTHLYEERLASVAVPPALFTFRGPVGYAENMPTFQMKTEGNQYLQRRTSFIALPVDTGSLEAPFSLGDSYGRLESFAALDPNWDEYSAQSPNDIAIERSKEILGLLYEMKFKPSSITPSREEGVTIAFHQEKKWAAIECANTGEIIGVTSDRTGNPTVWEMPTDTDSLRDEIRRIQTFLEQ